MSQRIRTPIGAGQGSNRLTRFYLPVAALERLQGETGPRGRSHWISRAITRLASMDVHSRGELLLHDVIVRTGAMKSVPVRLTPDDYLTIRRIVKEFRELYPSQDLDSSGVIRAGVLKRLRDDTGPIVLNQ